MGVKIGSHLIKKGMLEGGLGTLSLICFRAFDSHGNGERDWFEEKEN